mmetsp:Transcript_95641/g.270451  ORF Transcript_95641/g.270451 Transcript_95641/m.270451 type:complete len:212 (-) Transcript_95641:20-655(-)
MAGCFYAPCGPGLLLWHGAGRHQVAGTGRPDPTPGPAAAVVRKRRPLGCGGGAAPLCERPPSGSSADRHPVGTGLPHPASPAGAGPGRPACDVCRGVDRPDICPAAAGEPSLVVALVLRERVLRALSLHLFCRADQQADGGCGRGSDNCVLFLHHNCIFSVLPAYWLCWRSGIVPLCQDHLWLGGDCLTGTTGHLRAARRSALNSWHAQSL